jgi:hypothetical protein
MYTCTTIAREMKGVALRLNRVTFFTGDREAPGDLDGLRSKAGRFKIHRDRIAITRRQVLLYAQDCITVPMLDEIAPLYQDDGRHLTNVFYALISNHLPHDPYLRVDGRHLVNVPYAPISTELPHIPYLREMNYNKRANVFGTQYKDGEEFSPDMNDAMLHLLKLASTHPNFRAQTEMVFDVATNKSREWDTYFRANTAVYEWNPPPWTIPSATDIINIERHLRISPEEIPGASDDLRWMMPAKESTNRLRWHFSAAAVAIEFISAHPHARVHMRHVTLHEDLKSVSSPECHAQGLVPFCKENPALRIERRIGFWSNLYPAGWSDIRLAEIHTEHSEQTITSNDSTAVVRLLRSLAPWIKEIEPLRSMMPPGAFTLVLEGTSTHTLDVWEFVKQAAARQGAQKLYYAQQSGTMSPLPTATRLWLEEGLYPQPCDLPINFYRTIESMSSGSDSIAKFDGILGVFPDYAAVFQQRTLWTVVKWIIEWQRFTSRMCQLPEGGLLALSMPYSLTRGIPPEVSRGQVPHN